MNKKRKLIIAGNWKMNKTVEEALDMVRRLKINLANVHEVDVVICPPFTALSEVSKALLEQAPKTEKEKSLSVHKKLDAKKIPTNIFTPFGNPTGTTIRLGAQNMSENGYGAFTGEIAAGMLKEFSVRYVILGHSERRQFYFEKDELIAKKVHAAHAAALKPIICVGETLEQRESDRMQKIIEKQVTGCLKGLNGGQVMESVIAYEPVWAIGTGKTATPEQVQEVHAFIRAILTEMFDLTVAQHVRIQYGGSVKPGNARELMELPDVDGALVGGASLDERSFSEIIKNSI